MNLIEAFETGRIESFDIPDKVIETLLSKLFFFGNRVIKVYKHKEAFYGNLSDFNFRKEFYAEDFFWNHEMTPEIYLELVGVRQGDGTFKKASLEAAEDFYIEMAAIDSSKNLTNLLVNNLISNTEVERLTEQLILGVRLLANDRRERLKSLFDLGWMRLQEDDLEDLRSWIDMVEDKDEKEGFGEVIDLLKNYASQTPYFIKHNPAFLSATIDNNSDNLLMINGEPGFIDIMPPKHNWRVGDEYFNVVRTAVDCRVLGSEELGDLVYGTYQRYRENPPYNVTVIYEIRSALIQWAYRHVLNQMNIAQKFKSFALKRVEDLKSL